MEFLVIVVALSVVYLHGTFNPLHLDQWYLQWLTRLNKSVGVFAKLLVLLLVPMLVTTLLLLFVIEYTNTIVLFFFNLLVLLLSFGRGDLNAKIGSLKQDFSRRDTQAAYHDLADFNPDHHESDVISSGQFQEELLHVVSYRLFEQLLPAIFWFGMFGGPGAVLYRCAALMAEQESDKTQAGVLARYVLWLLEWLPVRLLGFCFALVGNFPSCFKRWKTCLFCVERSSAQALGHYVQGALNIDVLTVTADDDLLELELIRQLFHRAVILWVCAIALLVVI